MTVFHYVETATAITNYLCDEEFQHIINSMILILETYLL